MLARLCATVMFLLSSATPVLSRTDAHLPPVTQSVPERSLGPSSVIYQWGPYDFESGWQGWTSVDFTTNDYTYAHRTNIASIPGGIGLGSTFSPGMGVWIGTTGPLDCDGSVCFPGYANNVNQVMFKSYSVPFGATLTYEYRVDSEPGYDITSVIISRDGAGCPTLTPSGAYALPVDNSSLDTLTSYSGNVEGSEAFDLSPYAGQTICVIFTARSDGGFSDADCQYNSQDGLFEIDAISVTGSPTSTFEIGNDGWTFGPLQGVGVHAQREPVAGLPQNGTCGLSGQVVTMYEPTDPNFHPAGQNEVIVSPVLNLVPMRSLPADSVMLQADIYANLPIQHGTFYHWLVRYSPIGDSSVVCSDTTLWSSWAGTGTLYYDPSPPFCSGQVQFNITPYIPLYATRMQVALGVVNVPGLTTVPGGNQSPYFDNISVLVVRDSTRSCRAVPDTCCEAPPTFTASAYSTYLGNPVTVATCWAPFGDWPVVAVHRITTPPAVVFAPGANWAVSSFHGPTSTAWSRDTLGTVFGVTLDRYGNTYVTHTSCFGLDFRGKGGAGAVYRIDAGTGLVTVFATLPNLSDPSVFPISESYPGLGNITYDCNHNQFFVSNLEDGKIYRLIASGDQGPSSTQKNATATVDAVKFDYGSKVGLPDNGAPGWTQMGRRVWAVQWHAGRLYFGVWSQDAGFTTGAPNSIWSVDVLASGDFGTSLVKELQLPSTTRFGKQLTYSNPISDISFNAAGDLLCAARGISTQTMPVPHEADVKEFTCAPGVAYYINSWIGTGHIFSLGYSPGAASPVYPASAAGGVDYDRAPLGTTSGLVWATGDALDYDANSTPNVYIYGLQGMQPTGGSSFAPPTILIDLDDDTSSPDKTQIGDVEVPCAGGSIQGRKWEDQDRDGVRDTDEAGVPNWLMYLKTQATPPVLVASTQTDASGNYTFANVAAGAYTVCEGTLAGWIATNPTSGGRSVTVTGTNTVTGIDFGNYHCQPDTCFTPTYCTTAQYKFDECSGGTANDVAGAHPGNIISPQWGAGIFGCAIRCGLGAAALNVPNNPTVNFGSGDFSITLWIKSMGMQPTTAGLIEHWKANVGYRLSLKSNTLTLDLGTSSGLVPSLTAPGTVVTDDKWHFIAVTVCRNGTSPARTMYVDGKVVASAAGNFTGSVTNTNPLYGGLLSSGFGQQFSGMLDELTLHKCCLDEQTIRSLYAACDSGLCDEACYVTPVISGPNIGPRGLFLNTVKTTLTICNFHPTQETYSWSIAPVPAGVGCAVNGPTGYAPQSGTMTVPGATAGPSWKSVPITITMPPLSKNANSACYTVTIFNQRTGKCHTCTGVVRSWLWDIEPCCPELDRFGPGGQLLFKVTNHDSVARALSYQIIGRASDRNPTNNIVSVNGLPPGTPFTGSTALLAPGDSATIDFTATLTDFQPLMVHEVVLLADLDGDAVLDELGSIPLAADIDSLSPPPNFGQAACTPDSSCVPPRPTLVSWWPLDEGSGTTAHELGGGSNGTVSGTPAWGAGVAGGALTIADNTQYVSVPTAPEFAFGSGGYTLSAWVWTNASSSGERAIIDKRAQSTVPALGFGLYLSNDRLATIVGNGTAASTHVSSGPSLADGHWHFVAASVHRDSTNGSLNTVTLYVDGKVVGVFDAAHGNAPVGGSVTNGGALFLGHRYAGDALLGVLDEPQIFQSALDSTQVNLIQAGCLAGTCMQDVVVPSAISTCGPTAQVTFDLRNFSLTPQTYQWAITGRPVDVGCDVDGPTLFAPQSGTITVPGAVAGLASVSVPVTITVPAPLSGTTVAACYRVTMYNAETGRCASATGVMRASGVIWSRDSGTPLELLAGAPTPAKFTLANAGPTPLTLPYRLVPRLANGDSSYAPLSLNGQASGAPIAGSLTIAAGDSQAVNFTVIAQRYEAYAAHEIVLEADIDGDGVYEPLSVIMVHTLSSNATGSDAPPVVPTRTALHLSPRPFRTTLTIDLALQRSQRVEVMIADIAGRRVRQLQPSEVMSASHHILVWDGRTDAGAPATNGLYFVVARTEERTLSEKVMRLR